MPIYGYRCTKGHAFEVMQRMSDDTLTECTVCGAPVQRVFHPVAVHFKGSGFYNTDYGKKKGGSSTDTAESSSSDGDSKKKDATSSTAEKSKSDPGGSSTSTSD